MLLPAMVFGQLAPPRSVAVSDDIFAVPVNPAGLAVQPGTQLGLLTPLTDSASVKPAYYLGGGDGASGAAVAFYKPGKYYHYRLAFSAALASGFYFGYGVELGKGIVPSYSLGFLYRPIRQLSLGAAGYHLTGRNGQPAGYRTGIGLRPFGNRITLGADALLDSKGSLADAELTLAAEPVNGVVVEGFYTRESQTAGISLGVNFAHHGVRAIRRVSGTSDRFAEPVGVYHYTDARRRSILSPVTSDKFVLLEFSGSLPEERPRFSLFGKRGGNLTDMVLRIRRYAHQADVAGLVLYIKGSPGGPAKVEEIRNAIREFKRSGKPVYAYLDDAGNAGYLLASAADQVFLNPAGDVWLTGIATQLVYFKSLLEKVGIRANTIHIGKYKSADEMFARDSASTANLEQLNAYLDDYYRSFTRDIARSRRLPVDTVRAIIDRGPFTALEAVRSGLVDSLLYRDQLRHLIEQSEGRPHYRLVSRSEEEQAVDWHYDWEAPNRQEIAVIFAIGPITGGESRRSPLTGSVTMGAETIARAIRTARKSPAIKAIVLRVDSPGGSALASDIIWREVHLTTTGEDAKPVVVSMGNVAASGGYYISAAADKIVAQPGTVTGSIGVIFGQLNYQQLLEKIGVNVQTLQRGKNAALLDPAREMTEPERRKIYRLIDTTYQRFVRKVADGRGLPADSVDALGQGRIYSGEAAVHVGLVDGLGGVIRAVDLAKTAANIPASTEAELRYYPNYPLNLFDFLTQTPTFKSKATLPREIVQALQQAEQMTLFGEDRVLYLLPYVLQLKNE